MTRARSSGARSSIVKIAVAGVLIATPTATVSVPAYAAPGFGGTPNTPAVLPAPPPADPPTDAPTRHRLPLHLRRLRRGVVTTTTTVAAVAVRAAVAVAVSEL